MEVSTGTSALENPFTFKMGQVFTGFGVGCGVGIGVGRPLNLGAIPVINQVMSATRGATDAVSGLGVHVNTSLRRLGLKKLEAGVGCGIGVGHGFGVGISLKPGVINRIQFCLGQMVAKMVGNFGGMPGLPVGHNVFLQTPSGINNVNESFKKTVRTSSGNILQMISKSGSGQKGLAGDKAIPSAVPFLGIRSEKVINSFLNNPTLQDDKEMELNELATSKLQSENNIYKVLLKHQRIIDELTEEHEKLRQTLIKELKVSPEKLQTSNDARVKVDKACTDCFECQWRRRRKSSR